jgi:hypothetical protein
MVPKEAILARRLIFQRCNGKVLRHQFMESSTYQVGLTTDQVKQALALPSEQQVLYLIPVGRPR